MGLTIRDDVMSFMQEEIAALNKPFAVIGCMDRRLTPIFKGMQREGSTIIRTAGGFLNGSKETVEQLVREYDNIIVTSHRGCGAANVVAGAEKDKAKVTELIYEQMVKPFALKGCGTSVSVEQSSPEMQKSYIESIAMLHGFGEKNVITRCMDTPKPKTEKPSETGLVITTPLKCRYSDLPGVNVEDDTKYYLHNRPEALKCDIWVAITAIKVSNIQLIAQNTGENEMMTRFAESLKSDPDIQRLGVRINQPRLSDRTMKVGIMEKPSAQTRERAKL
jgi:hypothetical protein